MEIYEKEISDWAELEEHLKKKSYSDDAWIFRGQECSGWGLKTKLERTLLDQSKAPVIEMRLKKEFERRYHHFESMVPETDEYVEWFALMQHYGAPTRMLDWTYSPYVAAFFALEKPNHREGCAIWAINSSWLDDKFKELILSFPKLKKYANLDFRNMSVFEAVYIQPCIPLVNAINSYKLNIRQTAQQGVFLCPGKVSVAFEDNLAELVGSQQTQNNNFIKFVIQKNLLKLREIGLRHLHSMNINNATLFPGLEGFARSLETRASFDQDFYVK